MFYLLYFLHQVESPDVKLVGNLFNFFHKATKIDIHNERDGFIDVGEEIVKMVGYHNPW